jgi:site-specific recombinase XerD
MDHKPKLLDLVRHTIRLKHYSIRTERAYIDWIRRFILFHQKRHPASMGAPEVRGFLSHLAAEQKVGASTQRQALSAIVFLYREILNREGGWLGEIARAKYPERLPVVFSRAEVRAVLAHVHGQHWLMASLLYGAGLRLMEWVWHQQDLAEGFGEVYLPFALERKYSSANHESDWQYVFPARRRSIDPHSGKERRHHIVEKTL